ncbi:hypothetical protein WJX74_003641 [Apatococcus lobatus]|uniref:Uncharacterized protein n=1 Tax=Apatococcus lobatus TaxID=904363 RepID=A0AAW1QVM4_9CHLO
MKCEERPPSYTLGTPYIKDEQPLEQAQLFPPAASTNASFLRAKGSINSQLLEQLAIGAALLARGMNQLPESATIPVTYSPPGNATSSLLEPPLAFSSSVLQTCCSEHMPLVCSAKPTRKRARIEPQLHAVAAQPASDRPRHPLLSHQEQKIAASLTAMNISSHASSRLTEPQMGALQRLARARGLPVREITDLKRHNLQSVKLRGEWHDYYAPAGKSLLDMYDAFARGDMSFSFPLMLNGEQQNISLGFIIQQDLPSLYMQAVGGLAKFAAQASSPHSRESQLFTKGVCQSLALVTCTFETPRHLMQLFTEFVCKSPADPRSHTNGAAHTAFLDRQLGQKWKDSITDAQRNQAQTALKVHRGCVNKLSLLRAEYLQQMRHDLQDELQGLLDPERLLQLSDKAHSLSIILGLAQETRLQLGRKMIYEILSPWQWGHISACFHPVMPDIVQCAMYIASDEPASPIPALSSRQCYAYSAIAIREQAAATDEKLGVSSAA